MKVDGLFDEVLVHLGVDALPTHEVFDRALEAGSFAAHRLLLREDVGERCGIDEIDVPANAAQIANGAVDGRLERAVVAAVNVLAGSIVTVGVREFDDAPAEFEHAGGPVVMQVSAVLI